MTIEKEDTPIMAMRKLVEATGKLCAYLDNPETPLKFNISDDPRTRSAYEQAAREMKIGIVIDEPSPPCLPDRVGITLSPSAKLVKKERMSEYYNRVDEILSEQSNSPHS